MNSVAGATQSNRIARILVVDNHPIVYEGLARVLEREPELRADWLALSAEEALGICKIHCPEMTIVEILLKDGSGIDLIRGMHDHWPTMLILVLSGYDDPLYAERALRAGARGYVMKHSAPKDIVDAIRQVRDGRIYLSDRARSRLLERVIARVSTASTGLAGLSDRELEIFELFGKGLKKKEIATRLSRSVNTVEAHRASIKKKLKVSSGAEVARLAFLHSQIALWPRGGG